MELQNQISIQRVKHIVNSYQIQGKEPTQVESYLEQLLVVYAPPLIELALVETLVDVWVKIPSVRGVEFMTLAHDKLKYWEQNPIVSTISPGQFQQISGLDPTPVFGPTNVLPNRSIAHPGVAD